MVIAMIIFLQVSRSLAEPHSSASVQFVTALMSSSQRARGLPLFLVPPPIPNIIDFSKLFSLRMICPKYDSCCFFINISNGLVAIISSITDLLVRFAVHGIRSSLNFVVIVISLSFHILVSPVIATLPNANRLKISPLQGPESSILAPRKTKSRTTPTFSPSISNSLTLQYT